MSISPQFPAISLATPTYVAAQLMAARPANVDPLLLRKVVRASELLVIGAADSALAMLTHVLDVAEEQDPLHGPLFATARRLLGQAA